MLQKEFGPAARGEPKSSVELFAPWAGSEERSLRQRIHRARDIAQARAARKGDGFPASIYSIAAEIASEWVFQRAQTDDLNEVIAALTYLFLVAGKIERLEASHD